MKQCSKVICVIGLVFFVVGLVLLFNSGNFGIDASYAAIQKNGGTLDTERSLYIMQSTANAYLVGGAIVAVIGGLASIAFGYRAVK